MKEKDRTVARELERRLARVATVVDFRVFGSRARGSANEHSDLDVFIEVEAVDAATRDAIDGVIWEVSFRHCIVISPFIATRQEIEETALRSSPIVLTILEEGVKP